MSTDCASEEKSEPASNEMLKWFDCSICGKTYSGRINFNRHYRSAHWGVRFHCQLCGSGFTRKHNLKRHMQSSHGSGVEKMFDCSECEKKFSEKKYLNQHCRLVHSGERFYCESCGKHFAIKSSLKRHVQSYHSYGIAQMFDCTKCEKKYSESGNLKRHYLSAHLNIRFCCELCGKGFVMKADLRSHIRSTHLEIKFKCVRCDKGFSDAEKLKIHADSTHFREGGYECYLCGKVFSTKGNLKNHADSTHLKIKFECNLCAKSFTSKDKLKLHIGSTHLNIRNECNLCGKSFTRKDKLKIHIKATHFQISTEKEGKLKFRNDLTPSAKKRDLSQRSACEETSRKKILTNDKSASFTSRNSYSISNEQHLSFGGTDLFGTNQQNENESELSQGETSDPCSPVICPSSIVETTYDAEGTDENPISPKSSQSNSPSRVESAQPPYFRCRECVEVFYQEEDLVKHMEIHNIETKEFVCVFCKDIFTGMVQFQSHLHSHFE